MHGLARALQDLQRHDEQAIAVAQQITELDPDVMCSPIPASSVLYQKKGDDSREAEAEGATGTGAGMEEQQVEGDQMKFD